MKEKMILLDLFSGIGGFHKGLEQAGFNFSKTYFAEIDKYAIGTYKYNFKNQNIEHIGDVRTAISTIGEAPDIITFGSPCQDFSIAGKRAGLEGKRSNLLLTALDIVRTFKPQLFIWENVKGTFSSNGGRDFVEVLRTIADIGLYECEWQLVNTKWILPQNRERIYLVGHLAEKRGNFRKVFPIGGNGQPYSNSQRGVKSKAQFYSSITTREGQRKENNFVIESQIADYRQDEGLRVREDNLSPTLQARAREDKYGVPMVIGNNVPSGHEAGNIYSDMGIAPTVREMHGKITKVMQTNNSKESGGKQPFQQNRVYDINGLIPAIPAQLPDMHKINLNNSIRRLTPIECERLQGYPDNYTKYRIDEKNNVVENSDSQRYKMIGNSVTVDIVKMIGTGLLE